MKFKPEVETIEVKVSIAEQIKRALEGNSRAAVIMIPDGDDGMRYIYRSGQAGGGGAWWKANYNEPGESVVLKTELKNVTEAYLVRRDDIQE